VLLVLDDLHRADRSTLRAVLRVVEAAADARLLVVGTYRDTALDRSHPLSELLVAVQTRPGVERMSLHGLSPEALAEMVGDSELARHLWRRSEGSPVRVAELLRPGALDGFAPAAFDELVAGRVETLSPAVRRFVEAAAVAGSAFSVEVAAAASGVAAERVPAVVKQLVAAGFLVEEAAGAGVARRFVHDVVREAIERQLGPAARVRLHQRIADGLEHRDEGAGTAAVVPAAVLAWHSRAAAPVGGSVTALRHSARAGDRAMELLAWEEAAVQYGHALAAASGTGPAIRADLLLALGEAQRLAGETARARQAFLEAATLARAGRDGARFSRAVHALRQVFAVWGVDPELESLAYEARALLGEAGPAPSAPVRPFDFSSDSLYDVLDGVAPEPPPAAVVTRPGRPAAAGALLRARRMALSGPEHAAGRLATADDLVRLAADTADDELAVTGLAWRSVDALGLGRVDEAVADRAAHAELARRLGDPRHDADVAAWAAMRAILDGRADDARSAIAGAHSHAVDGGDPEAKESFLLQRWGLALEWGTSEDLSGVVEECRARASSAAGRTWRAADALALVRVGRMDEAAEELRRVTDHGLGELIRDPGRLHPLTCLAEVAWELGDAYRAATLGPLLEPYADRLVVAGRALVCRGSVARACALVAASNHQWDEAERQFQSALAVHRRIGALPLLARTQLERSRVLLERGRKGDRRRAAEARRKAAEIARRFGMSRMSVEIGGSSTG